VELAVAVVIGVAFGAVVASFVEDLLTPLIAAAGGRPDFSALTFEINESTFRYGQFVNAVVAFLVVAAAVYFLVVAARQRHGRALPHRAAAGPHREEVPRVPQRHPRRGEPLRLLHQQRLRASPPGGTVT
jgi:large conductance mechanosensitive channel